MLIKAVIFDWGRTLFDTETGKEFPEAKRVVEWCRKRGYRLAIVSLVSVHANTTLEGRKKQIENSSFRNILEAVTVTDTDKDKSFDEVVEKLNLPREEILIVDDRMFRGIKYGNLHGHPTVWLQKGKFANELPNEETKPPTFTIHSLTELTDII